MEMKANPANPRRVLLVEDEDFLRELTADLLSHEGWEVQTARDGQEALDLFRSQPAPFTLVVSDYQLPQMNGDALIGHLKDLREDLPVVLHSGGIPTPALLSIVRHPRTVAVAKPATAAKFLSAIEHVLRLPFDPGTFRRRAAFRVKTLTPAEITEPAKVSHALIRDLSTQGALLEFSAPGTPSEAPGEPGEPLRLRFAGKPGIALELSAAIVWKERVNAPGDSIQWIRAGVRFKELAAETFQALQAWVEAEFERTRAGWY